MANNPYVNKVIYGNDTVMDISDTTAEEADVETGKVFYKANGARSTGTGSTSGAAWGQITGTLSDQTDLNTALGKKYDKTDDLVGVIADTDTFPLYSTSFARTVKTSFSTIKNAISGAFKKLIERTVGWVSENLADLSKAEIGKTGEGVTDPNCARFVFSCESSKTYYVLVISRGAFSGIRYKRETQELWQSITNFPSSKSITTNASDTYITFEFEKNSTVTQSDIDALQFMISEDETLDYVPYHASVEQTLRDAEVIEGKNLLDYTEWKKVAVHNGTGVFKNNGIQITATSDDCYTDYSNSVGNLYPEKARISVKANEKVIITWKSNSTSQLGKVHIFPNGDTAGNVSAYNDAEVLEYTPTSNGYITFRVGVLTSGNSLTYSNIMICTEEEWNKSHDYEPYYIPLKDGKFDRAEQKVLGAKNILPLKIEDIKSANTAGLWSGNTYTYNSVDVAFTVDSNGYVTEIDLNGTASVNNFDVNLYPNTINKFNGYFLSGIKDGGDNICRLYIWDATASTSGCANQIDKPVYINAQNGHTIRLLLGISNVGFNHKKIYPMVTVSADTNFEYVPYAMTNKELTDRIIPTPTPSSSLTESSIVNTIKASQPSNNEIPSLYGVQNWSNAEITTIIANVDKDDDTIGTWTDTWETDGVRTGWIWHSELYNVLSDNEVEITIDFDVAGKEVVGLYAYRIDDNVTQTIGGETVNGGAIAIKLTSPIQNASGVNVAVNLKRQRTNKVNATYIS